MRRELLQMLAVVRVATAVQLAQVATPKSVSTRYVRRALRNLQLDGFVDGTETGYAGQMVWYLTSAGVRAVAEAAGRAAPKRRTVSPALVASGLLDHPLDVTGTMATFAPAGADVEDWRVERLHRYGRAGEHRLLPDAVLTLLEYDGRRLPEVLFVEVDRATMSVPKLAAKLGRYADYAGSRVWPRGRRGRRASLVSAFERDYPETERCPPILIVLAGAPDLVLVRRAARLASLTAEYWDWQWKKIDVGVALLADLVDHGPLADVVMPLDNPGARIGVDRIARREEDRRRDENYLGWGPVLVRD